MRQIKFRAWNKDEDKMIDNYVHIQQGVYSANSGSPRTYTNVSVYRTPVIQDHVVMQFTGLHDKNGKEIYEGDLIKVEGFHPMVVEFDGGMFHCNGDLLYEWLIESPEVIGNIFQNKELIEQ